MSSTEQTHILNWLVDRHAIAELVNKYCYFFDRNMPQDLSELFTNDAEIDYGPEVEILRGRNQILEMVSKGLSQTFISTSHHVSNFIILEQFENMAKSSCYVYAWHQYQSKKEIGHIWGEYEHQFKKSESGWLISSLRLNTVSTKNFHREKMHLIKRK